MARNIVICCDGTNNEYGVTNTSVVRVVKVVERDETTQVIYYDPGVGTMPEPRMLTRVGKKLSRWWALAVASDLTSKVLNAYLYLVDIWEPGDRIFLFGFSRGAYTVRVLAGLVHSVGLLPKGNVSLAPYAMRLYAAREHDESYWRVANGFRATFGRAQANARTRAMSIHFMGVWDTVSSVGYLHQPTFPYVTRNPAVKTVRQALALDERRWFFRQNRVKPVEGQNEQQVWFPGVHSDVGGGYAETLGGLWRTPFDWIITDAERAGLLVNWRRYQKVLGSTPLETSWCDAAQESLTRGWSPAEFVPRRVYNEQKDKYERRFGLFGSRTLLPGELLHPCVAYRIQKCNYRPRSLSEGFVERVRNEPLPTQPFPYTPEARSTS